MIKKPIQISAHILSFFLLCFSFSPFSVNAQCDENIKLVENTRIADSLFQNKKHEKSIQKYKETLLGYEEKGCWVKVANVHNQLAKVYLKTSKFDEAYTNINLGLKLFDKHAIEPTGASAKLLNTLGRYYLVRFDNEKAIEQFQKSVLIQKKTLSKFHPDIANNYIQIAQLFGRKSDFTSSAEILEKVKIICDNNPDENQLNLVAYYGMIARMESVSVQNEKAITHVKKALEILYSLDESDAFKIAQYEFLLGGIFYNARNYDEALEYYSKTLPFFKEEYGADSPRMTTYYNAMARALSRLGVYQMALEYVKKSLEITKASFGVKNSKMGNSYNVLASVYDRMEKDDEALKYYRKAVENYEYNLGENNRASIFAYANMGSILANNLGDIDTAEKYFQKSIEIAEAVFGKNYQGLGFTYQSMAEAQLLHSMPDKAFENLNKALVIRKNENGDKNWALGLNYISFGEYYEHINEHENALEHYNKALQMYDAEYSDILETAFANVSFDVLSVILNSLNGIGRANKKLYVANNNEKHLYEAKTAFEKADLTSRRMRDKIVAYEDKIKISEINKQYISDAIETHYLLADKYSTLQHDEDLFAFFEKSRANILSEKLANISLKKGGEFQQLFEREKNIKNSLSRISSQIKKEKDKGNLSNNDTLEFYKNEYFTLVLAQDSLINSTKKKQPAYYINNFSTAPITILEIQKKIDNQTTLLEFFMSGENTFVCLITKENYVLRKLPTPDLEKKIKSFNSALISREIENLKLSGYEIYQNLLEPLRENFVGDALIIIPHEFLWGLNFDILLTQNNATNNPKKLPFLMREYAISYANSASLQFQYDNSSESLFESTECLAFSFSNRKGATDNEIIDLERLRNSKSDLPGTRKEIGEIADLIDGTYYYGSAASEANFKSNAGNFAIVHLALHGEVDHEIPSNSRLLFNQDTLGLEDNYLYISELIDQHIPANLAVLSACNTGSGKVINGEGIMSLGNAFQYAGTKSMVLSRWEVSDETTPELTKLFYQNLKNGMSKSKALQQAKISFLNDAPSNRSHPFYWGSFYLVGDTTPINFGSTQKWPYILLGLLVILGGAYWLRSKSKKAA